MSVSNTQKSPKLAKRDLKSGISLGIMVDFLRAWIFQLNFIIQLVLRYERLQNVH